LYAGCGYGGSCFPKDTRALVSTAAESGLPMRVVIATEEVNDQQKRVLIERTRQFLGDDLSGKKIAVWGLAFKPNTDDMREASSRTIVPALLAMGAQVIAFDPVAAQEGLHALQLDCADRPQLLQKFSLAESAMQALDGADALLVVTEWKIFHNPDFYAMKAAMRQALIVDGRNLYNPELLQDMGILYQGIGRRNALAQARLKG